MRFFKHILRSVAALAFLASFGAQASPITFFHSGSGSGTLNGVGFSNKAFTITALANTEDRENCSSQCLFITHTSASIDIQEVGEVSFLIPTRTFMNDGNNSVGFSRGGISGADLFDGPFSFAALDGYDLISAIGPLTGAGNLLQWGFSSVNTSGGILFFGSASTSATFQATLASEVPEPASLALVTTALLGCLASRRRRNRI